MSESLIILVERLISEMRAERPRYKSRDLGFVDSVSSNSVDEWADELEAALARERKELDADPAEQRAERYAAEVRDLTERLMAAETAVAQAQTIDDGNAGIIDDLIAPRLAALIAEPWLAFLKTLTDLELVRMQHEARRLNDTITLRAVLEELGQRVKNAEKSSR